MDDKEIVFEIKIFGMQDLRKYDVFADILADDPSSGF